MNNKEPWLQWAIELQSIAQIGLSYSKDVFDAERYERIREIAAEIIALQSDIPVEKVQHLFCNETGYQTPKLDTRAAIFQDGKILLVEEKCGKWSLPGGWVDVHLSIKENTIKEVKEESGLDVCVERLIAVQDRAKHNLPHYAYGICKIFVQCKPLSGAFQENNETNQRRYFALHELPPLAEEKNNADQIALCFKAYQSEHWAAPFD
ncbi:MAG: NUDIX hydrolase [Akkermansia sp.]